MRCYYRGEVAFGRLWGAVNRLQVVSVGRYWATVIVGYSGHCNAKYSRVPADSLLPLPSTER